MVPKQKPGLIVLHGNRLEMLAEATVAWLSAHPLAALEEETVLVQSNGMAEWLKMNLAAARGICAATRVELPGRFIWRAYRAVLGRGAVPAVPALDKLPLTWRLMGLLPGLAKQPVFGPVAGFLAGGDAARRLQLAQRLADLFDQYQVYRSDWLQDWEHGRDQLRPETHAGAAKADGAVPDDQLWQPALWRAAVAGLDADEQQGTRASLHQRFLAALQSPADFPLLPRRVVLFGTTHIPHQTLEAIAALAKHIQVLMAVPNPCRYHWADIIDGRELLRAARRRHPLRQGRDLAAMPLQDLHAHGHPLLAAWGRQSRDFVRQLDAFDDAPQAQIRFELPRTELPRIDLFDDGPGQTLLQQVQASIRDLVPLGESAELLAQGGCQVVPADRSIVFHIAHSAQRQVEVLHDQLLHLLAHPPEGRALNPRDIVVMVPDIDAFAPAIRSVFGQHGRGHARHLPWGIADQRGRGHQPLLLALEWLLRAPQQRFTFSELRDLLDVPAVARRFGIGADDLPTLAAWIEGAGVRWGLHAAQREQLGLGACGEANTWRFGLRRMLLGYATGELDDGHAGIEPYTEVAGLSAALAGALAELLTVLEGWWVACASPRPPEAWGPPLRALLLQMFAATDDGERAVLAALDEALADWLQACEAAGFADPVELAVAREAWLDGVDDPGVSRRFKAGGVTFCTLLPMRAIPFEVVCLLGMNDGDYPRRSVRSDFDLMALPGLARPGDRSRRDDDRQLMLDALLSARRVLYLSWAGRSPRDNQTQPPSVLVSQLRAYLSAGWGNEAVQARTTEHPLQPFSRRYFELKGAEITGTAGTDSTATDPSEPALFTYAAEWRSAHEGLPSEPSGAGPSMAGPPTEAEPMQVTVSLLASFLRNPVKAFFGQRLRVRFEEREAANADDERFVTAGLDRWQLMDGVLSASRRQLEAAGHSADGLDSMVKAQVARLHRAGRLPMAGPGTLVRDELIATLSPMVSHWQTLQMEHPQAHGKSPLRLTHPDDASLSLDDWLVGLRSADAQGAGPTWIELQASKLADKKRKNPRPDKLLNAWVRSLASAACDRPAAGIVIGADVVLHIAALDRESAQQTLLELMGAYRAGVSGDRPFPTAVLTGLACVDGHPGIRKIYEGSGFGGPSGESREPCLARLYPDFAALSAAPGFESCSQLLYAPYAHWLSTQLEIEILPNGVDLDGDDDEEADHA